jgi:hypothetical protein
MTMPERKPALLLLAVAAACLALMSCRDTGAEGERFRIDGKLFVFNYRVATATYLVNLVPVQPPGDGQTAVATFEDPAGGEPIVVRQKIWPKLEKTTIESPPLRCVVKDRRYAVSIRIENAEGAVLQTIETTMTSSENQTILPDKPLVVGPFYTPNPELAGHSSGHLPDQGAPCPNNPKA